MDYFTSKLIAYALVWSRALTVIMKVAKGFGTFGRQKMYICENALLC